MLQRNHNAHVECRSRAGPMNARSLAFTAIILAAGLGLSACVGTYDDGYTQTRLQYQPSPNHYYDNGYEQRRGSSYRQYPNASPDQTRWNDPWWRGTIYSRNSYSYER